MNLLLCSLLTAGATESFAQSGFVKSGDQPIPGVAITASQGDQSFATVTDADGHYAFPPLGPGSWGVTLEMFGFEPLKQDVDYATTEKAVNFNLQLKESPILKRLREFQARRGAGGIGQGSGPGLNGSGRPAPGTSPPGEGLRTASGSRGGAGANRGESDQFEQQLQTELANGQQQGFTSPSATGTNDSFLVQGSLSPGLAQNAQADSGPDPRQFALNQQNANNPFGQANEENGGAPGLANSGGGFGGPGGGAGFGGRGGGGFGGPGGFDEREGRNGRPGQTAGAQFGNRRQRNQQIHGQVSYTLTNSAANAKPFSINGLDIPQAAYAQSRFSIIVGGPLVIRHIIKDPKTQFFITYFGSRARNPQDFTETVPTLLERQGNFSQAAQSLGTNAPQVPVTLIDPATRAPFPGNIIPAARLNGAAPGLLNYFPLPNQPGIANNYQYETANVANSDNLGVRVQRNITKADRLSLNLQFQNRDGNTPQAFRFFDATSGYGLNAQVQWTRNLNSNTISNLQFRFNRNRTEVNPYFAYGPNVAAELEIQGTPSNPLDYGPPNLNFTNYGSLTDSVPTLTRNQSQGINETVSVLKGVHSISLGAGYTRNDINTRTDPNARGTLNFTGVATSAVSADGTPITGTGYDLADFLLGLPQSSSIRYGNSSNYFRQNTWNLYLQDEWKAHPRLTLTLGVRYEYFAPLSEKYGRLANLDIAPGFTSVAVVTPSAPGPFTGAFPSGLIDPDRNNWSPRLALAWKVPHLRQSTVVRTGYGIYYNGQAYNQFANQLAQQPPFAKSFNVNTSDARVLSIESAFTAVTPTDITNTFAVDRNYRTPYAQTWNFTVQRDLGKGFFTELGYLGTKGTRLDVRTLPNEGPPGTSALLQRTQLGNAVGFTYDSSVGNSILHAMTVRAVQRFRRGLSLNAYYQLSKSIDDSSTLGGAGNTVAQNWRDISAERGLSSFDRRHYFNANFVVTSPVAAPGSRVAADSKVGRIFKDWQLSGGIVTQTGTPLTARQLGNTAQLAQTGGVGSGRAEATGLPIETGFGSFNKAAFTVAPSGQFGNAGRNTIRGPDLFTLNVAFARSFQLTESRKRLEIRAEASNVLNHVNFTNLYTVVNATNYGLPIAAANMRTLDVVARFRF